MTIVAILDVREAQGERCGELDRRAHPTGGEEAGLLAYAAGPTATGWCACVAWEDPSTLRGYLERLLPEIRELGLCAPSVRAFPADDVRRSAGATDVEIAQIIHLDGVDRSTFARLDELVSGVERRPASIIAFHASGTLGASYCVVELVTSRAHRDRVVEQRVRPALREASLPEPRFEVFPVTVHALGRSLAD